MRNEEEVGALLVGPEDLVEDGLDEEMRSAAMAPTSAIRTTEREGVERVGPRVVQQAPDASHACGLRSGVCFSGIGAILWESRRVSIFAGFGCTPVLRGMSRWRFTRWPSAPGASSSLRR